MENIHNEKLRSKLNAAINYFHDHPHSSTQYSCRTYSNDIKSIQKLKPLKDDNVLIIATLLSNNFFSILKKETFEPYKADTGNKYYFFENINFNDPSNANQNFYNFYQLLITASDMENPSFLKQSGYIINRLYDKHHELLFLTKGKPFVKESKLYYEIECDEQDYSDQVIDYNINAIKNNLMKIPTSLAAIIIDNILIILGDYGRLFFMLDKRDYIIATNNYNALKSNPSFINPDSCDLLWRYIKEENLLKTFSTANTENLKKRTLSDGDKRYLESKGVSIIDGIVQIRTNQDACYLVGLLSETIYNNELTNEDVLAKPHHTIKRNNQSAT